MIKDIESNRHENYKNDLDEKYLRLLVKKISVLEYELNSKLLNYQNNFEMEEELTTHRRR